MAGSVAENRTAGQIRSRRRTRHSSQQPVRRPPRQSFSTMPVRGSAPTAPSRAMCHRRRSTEPGNTPVPRSPLPKEATPMHARLIRAAFLSVTILHAPSCARTEPQRRRRQVPTNTTSRAGPLPSPGRTERSRRGCRTSGPIRFRSAPGSASTQRFINQGLNLAYAFNHAEARRAFREAARLSPESRDGLLGPGARARAQHQRAHGAQRRAARPRAREEGPVAEGAPPRRASGR